MLIDDTFRIYVDQLRDGHEKLIHEEIASDFLDIHEKELTFNNKIFLDGTAYLAEQELILHWKVEAEAFLPCSICNDKVSVPIKIDYFYHAEPLSSIKTGIFDFRELLRETILIEVPGFAECNGGNCAKRKEVGKYLKESSKTPDPEGYQPFADLDL